MDNANQPVTISTDSPTQPASDFRFLRNKGIEWIQKLAATTWTDHNTHDPGITILDLLCYAITDLSNRLDYDIKDLLATQNNNPYESLYSPALVLTVNPVTITDIRKTVIDLGAINAWVQKQTEAQTSLPFSYLPGSKTISLTNNSTDLPKLIIKGIYNISAVMDSGSSANSVLKRLHSYRNLCEDFNVVQPLNPQYFKVTGIIEIERTDNINKTVAGILYRIEAFISPRPRFYTLAEMMAKGKTIDEIFEGPVLLHGFLDDEELGNADLKTELHTSDIIREMMDEAGVERVSNISINDVNSPATGQNWELTLDKTKFPVLDVEGSSNSGWLTNGDLQFKKNGILLSINPDEVREIFKKLKNSQTPSLLARTDRDIVPKAGHRYPLGDYHSIQYHFPQVYGIGEAGLPDSATALRKAQAKQLKAYLLFFEQILANSFSQAGHLGDLFSFTNDSIYTYQYQPLQDTVPAIEDIIADNNDKTIMTYVESDDDAISRKNRFLDHLVARFGESFAGYSLHQQSYEQASKSHFANAGMQKLMTDKLRFLSIYPRISNDRGKAFNYKSESWNTDNVSGLEKRIAAKLGIENYQRRNLAAGEEGFHLLEHVLLKPVLEDSTAIVSFTSSSFIEKFEDGLNGYVNCMTSKAHNLLNGEEITISHEDYDGIYRIKWLSPNEFQIQATFKDSKEPAQWNKYTAVDILQRDVILFDKDSALPKASDIYSLQMTFFLPSDAGRFSDAEFCRFVENIIREETPVHLTVYVYWFKGKDDTAARFETFFKGFLEQLANYQNEWFPQKATSSADNVPIRLQNDKIIFRANRNSLLDALPLAVSTYPLADIPAIIPADAAELIVQFNEAAKIVLAYSQPDVIYKIQVASESETKDDKNNLTNGSGDQGNGGQLILSTGRLTNNYTFSIEATNQVTGNSIMLLQTISVKIGINVGLRADAKKNPVNYGDQGIVTIVGAQSGTRYQVVDSNNQPLSAETEIESDGDLDIAITNPLQEDVEVSITATNIHTSESSPLTAKPTIRVYPNVAIAATLEKPSVDYKGEEAVLLNNTQQSVFYQLRFVDIDDDIADKQALTGVAASERIQGNAQTLRLPVTYPITEDLTVNIQATKKVTDEQKTLPETIVIPVKPAAPKTLTVVETGIKAGDTVTIKVNNTQPGVMYQLRRKDGDNFINVGVPVYHSKNYGIGKARLEIEFIIDTFTGDSVFLPTGVINETTTFNVSATKVTTQLQTDIGNIEVAINNR